MVPIYCELLYFMNKLTGLQLTSCVVYLCFNCSYSHIEWAESSHHHCGGGGSRYHHPGLHGVRFHHREKVRSRGPHWLSATVSLVRSLSLPFCPSKATIAVEFTPSPTCVWSHPPTIMLYTVEMWPLMHFPPRKRMLLAYTQNGIHNCKSSLLSLTFFTCLSWLNQDRQCFSIWKLHSWCLSYYWSKLIPMNPSQTRIALLHVH